MQGTQSHTIFRKTWDDIYGVILHRWSLIGVAAITLILCIRTPWGLITIDAQDVASSIFQVAGTMVALVLPAAELSNSRVTRFEDLINNLLQEYSGDRGARSTEEYLDQLRENLEPAWRASVYALCSFILSILGMIVPEINIQFLGSYALSLDYLIVGASLGFIIIGAFWFYPTARYAFRLQDLDDMREKLPLMLKSQDKPTKNEA